MNLPSTDSKLLIVSTSKLHGGEYMDYLIDEVKEFFSSEELLFIPYARPGGISYEEYTAYPRKTFAKAGMAVTGIHEFADPKKAIKQAKGIFVGGGNTFVLLKTLYDLGLVEVLRQAVQKGLPYMGSSAGSNLTGLSIGTTNDMPIVYPPRFDALQLVPFNINPHYLDPDPNSTHQGETRQTRVEEFHHFNTQKVIGLREGSWLRVEGREIRLKGTHSARLFEVGKEPRELKPGSVSDALL